MSNIPHAVFEANRYLLKANWDEMDKIKNKTKGKNRVKWVKLYDENNELLKQNIEIANQFNPQAKAFFREAGVDLRKTPKISTRAKALIKALKYAPSNTKHYGHTESE